MSLLLNILTLIGYAIPWLIGTSIIATMVGIIIDLRKRRFYWTKWGLFATCIALLIPIIQVALTYQLTSKLK